MPPQQAARPLSRFDCLSAEGLVTKLITGLQKCYELLFFYLGRKRCWPSRGGGVASPSYPRQPGSRRTAKRRSRTGDAVGTEPAARTLDEVRSELATRPEARRATRNGKGGERFGRIAANRTLHREPGVQPSAIANGLFQSKPTS